MPTRTRFDRDYYRILDLRPEATEEEVRKAYRRLALQWHPDRNPGNPEAEERFKAISEAYAVLIDPLKRRDYDRVRQGGAPYEFHHSREDLFRDLFANPGASAVFEELAREFERMGMRVDRHHFHQTLFGGRAVVTGGIFIVTPLTPVFALFRLARAALRGARAAESLGAPKAPGLPPARGILERVARVGRWLMGPPPEPAAPTRVPPRSDLIVPLRLTRAEAERGSRKRVALHRGNRVREVLVTIPPGTQAGTKLRLRGRGRAAQGGGPPGDVYLAVEIADEAE